MAKLDPLATARRAIERALPHLQAVAADGIVPAHSQSAHYLALQTSMTLEDWAGARKVALAYTAKYADDPYGWLQLGYINDMLGRTADADSAFRTFRGLGKKDDLYFGAEIFNLDSYLEGPRGRPTPR